MKNFTFHNPTKIIFGKDSLARMPREIPANSKILLTYGGGSIQRLGIYDQVMETLKGWEVIPFGGIEPNPDVSTIRKAVRLGKDSEIDFVLAVGGGSVIDGSKLIAAAMLSDMDPWEIVLSGRCKEALPLGVVLTVPATGSEMNGVAVISSRERMEKFSFGSVFPRFSILDPSFTYSLTPHQVSCGIADAFIHVLEQYLTYTGQSGLMDRMAEGVLLNLLDLAPKRLSDPEDYDVACEYMLSAAVALNGFLSMGVVEDWLTHKIGHEITAFTGVTHGASLVMIYPSTLRILREQKAGKIIQMGRRVFGIEGDDHERVIDETIAKLEGFFLSLGLATSMKEAGIDPKVAQRITDRFSERGDSWGENGIATPSVIAEIIRDSIQ